MSNYRGPHASVTQQFVVSPGAIAVENLPPAIVATAFDVFAKESIGSHYGIIDQEIPWSDESGNAIDKVVYDKDVIDQRAFDFYPPKLFANSVFGNVDLELSATDISSTGPTVSVDKDFLIPNTSKAAGVSSAIIPYYNKVAQLLVSDTTSGTTASKLVDASVSFVTLGILPGDLVVNTVDGTSTLVTAVDSATVLSLASDIMTSGDTYTIYRPIKIVSTNLDTVIIPNGSVVTSQLKPGQSVFILGSNPADSTEWEEIGVVQSIGADQTKIILSTALSSAITGYQIIVGAATSALRTRPNTFYDAAADFIANKVKVGDLIYFSSQAVSGTIESPKIATVTSILNKNTLKFNTENLNASTNGQVDYDFLKYKFSDITPGSTVSVYSYSIKRLVGFSQNYGLKKLNAAAGVAVTKVSGVSFTIPSTAPALTAGDYFIISDSNIAATTEERAAFTNMRIYKIDTISFDGSAYTINTSSTINISSNTTAAEYADGDFIHAWTPKNQTDILGDFRAVRTEENKVVKRISSVDDIFTNWVRPGEESIDPRNELAFMMNIAFQSSGGKVCYGVNVDATAANLSAEYGDAFEELKLHDVYSHALGTSDAGVNGIVAAYVNGQSAPYEGHERVAILGYDQDDVFLQGVDNGSNSSGGLITISGAFNPITSGITVGDKVKIYNSSNVFQEEVSVTATPVNTTHIQTNADSAYSSGTIYKFLSGRKSDQAIKIGNLGLGERRVKIVWPGYFTADFGNETIIAPPYFIAAARAGRDCAIIASQSATNSLFGIPGLSNIRLNTNTYFLKSDLDEIGGGGIDVMIQESSISQTIKSRHDLTTDMSAVQLREWSVTKQADVASKTIRAAVAPYVGKFNITNDLFKFIGQICSIVSTKLVKDGVIQDLRIGSINRDEVIDDKINIQLTATAFIAGNYYDITMLVVTR